MSVAGASKVYKFKTVSRSVAANKLVKLRLKLAKKRLKAVKRALKRGKKLKAKVTVTATDKAGNKRAQKATHPPKAVGQRSARARGWFRLAV